MSWLSLLISSTCDQETALVGAFFIVQRTHVQTKEYLAYSRPNTLNDLFALDKVSSLYETLPTSCLGTLILSLLISFLVGIPSCKTKAASHLVAITLSDLSSSLKAFAKHINEYILLFFFSE